MRLILFSPGIVYNVFEAVDVITLIKGGVYDDLNLSVGEALKKRSPVSYRDSVFPFRLLLTPLEGLSWNLYLLD